MFASRPDRQCAKKKKKQVPIAALFVSHKGEVHSRSYGAEQIKL